MDAFEQLVAEALFSQGYWVETSVKVILTKEEKEKIGRKSSPRWELDLVAYRPCDNEMLIVECKSFLDSTGVQWAELQDSHPSTRYKLFKEPVLREVVLNRLRLQMASQGRCSDDVKLRLGMAMGKAKNGDEAVLRSHFELNGWLLLGPDWLRARLSELAGMSYSNQVSAIVSKLLLRSPKAAPGVMLSQQYRNGFAPDASITLLVSANPKKPKTMAYDRFQNYFKPEARTLAGALRAGVRWDDIRNDLKKEYIRIG